MQMKILNHFRDFPHKNRVCLSVPIDHIEGYIQSGLPKSTSFLAAIMLSCMHAMFLLLFLAFLQALQCKTEKNNNN